MNMSKTKAIRESARYVSLTRMGDQHTLIYRAMPGEADQGATRGGTVSWPWDQAKVHYTKARAVTALELMGYSGDDADYAVYQAENRGCTTITDTVEEAITSIREAQA